MSLLYFLFFIFCGFVAIFLRLHCFRSMHCVRLYENTISNLGYPVHRVSFVILNYIIRVCESRSSYVKCANDELFVGNQFAPTHSLQAGSPRDWSWGLNEGLSFSPAAERDFWQETFLLGCQTQSKSRFHFVGFFYWVAKPSRNLGFISWVFYWVAYGKPSRNLCLISWVFLLFSVSVKVLPVTPLLSGVFVHRVFCAYFVRFQGAGVMRSLLCTINL